MKLTNLSRPSMTDKFISAFSKLLWDTDLIASRCTLALAEFIWGILLLWPGATFERSFYHNMSYIATEEVWGILFIITAILQFIIVMRNVLHSTFARYFAGWNAFLWVSSIGSLLLIYPLSASLGGEVALVCISVWIFLRPYVLSKGYNLCKMKI